MPDKEIIFFEKLRNEIRPCIRHFFRLADARATSERSPDYPKAMETTMKTTSLDSAIALKPATERETLNGVVPKVSVIIPAYNAMSYLPATVETVLQQTYQAYEVVIVNDGSSDHIEQWFKSSVHDPRFRLVSQANQGLSGARNTGIAQARGEFLAFLDADDLWHPTKLEKQVDALERSPEAGLVYTWLMFVDETAVPTGRVVKHSFTGYVWRQLTAFNFVGCGSVAMVRSRCFVTAGVFDRDLNSYVEDWDMWLRVARASHFAVIREPLVYNRKYSGSLSTHWQKMSESFKKVIEKAFQEASAQELPLKRRSYAYADLCLAWKVIQSKNKQLKTAVGFWLRAFRQHPPILFVPSFLNLGCVLAILSIAGISRYSKVQETISAVRRRLMPRHLSQQPGLVGGQTVSHR